MEYFLVDSLIQVTLNLKKAVIEFSGKSPGQNPGKFSER